MPETAPETVFYFAYGANMSSDVFRRRRGLRPFSAEPARLENWQRVFEEPGLRFVEPVFASVKPQVNGCVHGVLYRLCGEQLEQLNRTEGAGYELITLTVTGEKSGVVEARGYRSKNPCTGRKPSRIYLNKLIRGALEHGLPGACIDELRRVDTVHLPLVSALFDKLVWLAIRRNAAKGKLDGLPLQLGASLGEEPRAGAAGPSARAAEMPPADSAETPPEGLLEVRGLTRAFHQGAGRREVLAGVDFQLRRGERLALLGRSGSGKSTLLNLIAGIDRADGGVIEMDGTTLTRLRENERTLFRRARIGFIHQFFNLIPTLDVDENIALPLQLMGAAESRIRAQTRAMLEAVGLHGRGGEYPDQLSGGEQQRVAIARALVHRPALVLADEPTGNLDAQTGRRILGLLTGLSEDARQTLLIVTHSLEVARTADRVIVLEGGRVRAAGADFLW